MGITNLRLGKKEDAQTQLEHARDILSTSEVEEEKLFSICAAVSLADIYSAEGAAKEASKLLDESLDDLADMPSSLNVDAHACRILHRKSLVDKLLGNKIRHRASNAAAVAAYQQLHADGHTATKRLGGDDDDMKQDDFDALVDPWFR